jgi:hypothetical protein
MMQTWTEKLSLPKRSHKKRLNKAVAGMPAGALMYISTPIEIDEYINAIPHGHSVSIHQMRAELAKRNQADCTCPLTTGIFLRIVAEAAFERIQNSGSSRITPFWRLIDPGASIVKKLTFGSAFIEKMRAEESIL